MKEKLQSFNRYLKIFFESLKLFWKASPLYTIILMVVIPVQGFLPSVLIWYSSKLVNTANMGFSEISMLIILIIWATINFFNNICNPINMTIQGLLTDKLIGYINLSLMHKSKDIKGLEHFENPDFYDDLKMIEEEAVWRPVNLMVFGTSLIKNIILISSMLILLASFHPVIALVMIISVVPHSLISYKLQQDAFETMVTRNPDARKLQYYSSVLLSNENAKETRLFNNFNFFINKYNKTFGLIHGDIKKTRFKQLAISIFFILLSCILSFLSFYWIINEIVKGALEVGSILVFSSTILYTTQGISALVEESSLLYDTLLYMEKFFKFMALKNNIYVDGKKKLNKDFKAIEFKDLSFSYPNSERVALRNISLSINKGEKIAIVGENGSGKSTLIKLLCRFYEAQKGDIFIDDTNIKDYDIGDYRSSIGAVFQDFSKFSLSVRENIAISNISELNNTERIEDAIKKGGFFRTFEKLDCNLEQILGKQFKDGTDLSGGEWQKLATSRAFMVDSEILILDEPTAALDARSEYEVYQQFLELVENKTVLFITHRLSAVKMADKVVALKDGEILEIGSHEELLEKKGYYYELYTMQAEAYI